MVSVVHRRERWHLFRVAPNFKLSLNVINDRPDYRAEPSKLKQPVGSCRECSQFDPTHSEAAGQSAYIWTCSYMRDRRLILLKRPSSLARANPV